MKKSPNNYWSAAAVVLIAAMRDGGPLMAWTVCAVMLFCFIEGLFGR